MNKSANQQQFLHHVEDITEFGKSHQWIELIFILNVSLKPRMLLHVTTHVQHTIFFSRQRSGTVQAADEIINGRSGFCPW